MFNFSVGVYVLIIRFPVIQEKLKFLILHSICSQGDQ